MNLFYSLESDNEQAKRRIKSRYAMSQMNKQGFPKPRFGSEAYRQYLDRDWISPEEYEADQRLAELRAEKTGQKKEARYWQNITQSLNLSPPPARWMRETPIPSDQYAPAIATTALRDDRLTPQAKALLMIIHARCGRDGETQTTKGTLASVMSRCERSIGRYVMELAKFGYIVSQTRTNARGLYIGLVLKVTKSVQPYWYDVRRCGEWIARTFKPADMPFPIHSPSPTLCFVDRTRVSYKNQFQTNTQKGYASGMT